MKGINEINTDRWKVKVNDWITKLEGCLYEWCKKNNDTLPSAG